MNNFLKLVGKMHSHMEIGSDKIKFSEGEKGSWVSDLIDQVEKYSKSTKKTDELCASVELVICMLSVVERMGMLSIFEEAFERMINAHMQVPLDSMFDPLVIPELDDLVKHLEK